MFQDVSGCFFPPMLALTSHDFPKSQTEEVSTTLLGLSSKKCDVCVSKCQSPAVPAVDKMLEVKSSDAVGIWMNSFAMLGNTGNTPLFC